MKITRLIMLSCIVVVATAAACFSRSLLGKRVYYVNAVTNKTGEATHWFVYLGQHECSLNRKYPGEEPQMVAGNMNFSLLSSGYIEASGFSARGKIEGVPTMKIRTPGVEHALDFDSIDYIFDFGQKVRAVNGEVGDFIIDLEGQQKIANRFLLTEYNMVKGVDGERELKKTGDDIPISAIATRKESILRAIKAMAAKPNADTTSAPPVE